MQFRNPRVQRLRRLLARRETRTEEGVFVIEGPKLLDEALRSAARIEAVFFDAADPHALSGLVGLKAPLHPLAPGVLARVSDAVAPQSILAVVAAVDTSLEMLRGASLLVVAVGIADPGNAGTVIRGASASGAAGVVFCDGSVDVYNPKTVRASAGSVFHVPVVVGGDAVKVLGEIGDWGIRRLGAVTAGGSDYDELDLTEPTAFVLGNEASGLSSPVRDALDGEVSIPMAAKSESLNVAMAASVLCFEAARQRRTGSRA